MTKEYHTLHFQTVSKSGLWGTVDVWQSSDPPSKSWNHHGHVACGNNLSALSCIKACRTLASVTALIIVLRDVFWGMRKNHLSPFSREPSTQTRAELELQLSNILSLLTVSFRFCFCFVRMRWSVSSWRQFSPSVTDPTPSPNSQRSRGNSRPVWVRSWRRVVILTSVNYLEYKYHYSHW